MSDARIAQAVALLRAGQLVAFPTETVYGLGADATNSRAVRRIFAAKGRPGTNPLIVHVADEQVARAYASEWPDSAAKLARKVWPGPLTLILPRGRQISLEVTGGLETVGLRAPAHPLALELLRSFGGPVAAPSANRSNRISPTTADHVRHELGEAVDLILDGGPCAIGIESTVLDLTRAVPAILRPGAISQQQLERMIGPVDLLDATVHPSQPASSPGQQRVHYSPATPAYRFATGDTHHVVEWLSEHPTDPAALLLIEGSASVRQLASALIEGHVIRMPSGAEAYARQLYAALRQADTSGATAILVEMPPADTPWTAVRDRIMRATRPL